MHERCCGALRGQTIAPAAPNAAPASQPSTQASATDIVGTWQGTLRIPKTDQHPQIDLRLIFKISRTDAGALRAVWYSIDQGGQPSPIATVKFQDGVLKFTVTVVPRSYEGKMSEDGKSIAGTWMEGTMPIALPLERANSDTAWAIPEPPKSMAANANPKFDVVTVKPSDPDRPGKLFTIRGRHVMTINTTVSDRLRSATRSRASNWRMHRGGWTKSTTSTACRMWKASPTSSRCGS